MAELGRLIEIVEVLSRVIVEEAVPGMMLGHALFLQQRAVVFGDWPRGDGHLVLLNAKCSAQAHGGGASVLGVDEGAFVSGRRAFSGSSLECAVGAMGFGLTYAGIEPILEAEWMPKICQVPRCLATEPNPVRQFTNYLQVVILECVLGAGNDVRAVPVHTVSSFVGRQVPHGWAAGGCIEALVVMVIPAFGWVAHMVVVLVHLVVGASGAVHPGLVAWYDVLVAGPLFIF